MSLDLKECFHLMSKYKVSDLHLKVGAPPLVRKNGQLMRLYKEQFTLNNEDIIHSVEPFLNSHQKNKLKKEKTTGFFLWCSRCWPFSIQYFLSKRNFKASCQKHTF